ncbi:hypothetical protein V5O48_009273 [Marasmius crinis-equi]|uniref:Uncharacterized protein n=1 Tax=Marasmius crinis-equi TaxID=585013 RepID=A0ABR3FBT6_9AGAR
MMVTKLLFPTQTHWTNVQGIIGADSSENPFNISGVAYSASLSAYRVFGCVGFVTDDVIVEALLLGVKDGQDILTLSLSGADGWTEATVSVVASRIAQSGTVVTAAAGNDGDIGSWYSSGPGNGIGVVSVASLDNTVTYLQSATVQGAQHAPIIYYNLFPMPVRKPIPIYATSNNTGVLDDACNPLPDNIPDLSQFLVVVRRGTCNILDKLTNIAAKGGQVAFVYDDGSGFSAIDVGNFTASLIQAADGEFFFELALTFRQLVKQFAAGASITVNLLRVPTIRDTTQIYRYSYGPTNDFFFKPAITAPGGNILSTLPVPLGSYGLDSGTSMATPFVAGSAALLLQMRGKSADFVRNIQTLLETTAVAVPADHSDDSLLQTLAQQGAGLLNVSNAAHTTTIVSPGELILNDTAHFHGEQQFTVHNAGSSEKTFNLSHIPAGTAITVAPGTIFPANGPLSLTNDFVTVALSETSFTLKADESKTITATFTPPEGLEPSTFPIISGFIRISPDGDAPLHVSYLGLAASLRDKQVLDTTDVFFGITLPALLNARGDVQEVPTNYTFNSDTADFPTVFFRLVFGTPILRLDLVDTSAKLEMKTGPSKRAATGEASFTFPRNISASFDDILTLGPLYEADYVPRNDDVPRGNPVLSLSLATPTFANGTVIPNGNYRILLRALRVTGDPEEDSDYESWLSPVIGVAVP